MTLDPTTPSAPDERVPDSQQVPEATGPTLRTRSEGRRRLLKAGVAVAPIILTITAGPAVTRVAAQKKKKTKPSLSERISAGLQKK